MVARSVARVACGLALASSTAGCEPPPRQARPIGSVVPVVTASPRLPRITHFLEHDGVRCAVFSEGPAGEGKRHPTRCPREIVAKERIRTSGRVCLRESADPARRVAVRCPGALVKHSNKSRARPDAGL